jgi:hypothetical protein
VAKQVVEVAADALALGDACHLDDRLLRHAQLVALAAQLGEVDVRAADDSRDDQRLRRTPRTSTASARRRAPSRPASPPGQMAAVRGRPVKPTNAVA